MTNSLSARLRAPVEARRRRRYNCHEQRDPRWERRAEAAAELLASRPGEGRHRSLRIADLGAGSERLRAVLEHHLREPFSYAAYDLHPQQPSTHQLDLSSTVPEERYDVVFLLGVLEYLPRAAELPARLRACCEAAVVSYVPSDAPADLPTPVRESIGWRSHLSRAELERAFASAGFELVSSREIDDGDTWLWLWSAT